MQKLKAPRALEEEELRLFTSQRDNELRHVARALATHRCDDGEACAAAAAAVAASAAQRLRASTPAALFATRGVDERVRESSTHTTPPVRTGPIPLCRQHCQDRLSTQTPLGWSRSVFSLL